MGGLRRRAQANFDDGCLCCWVGWHRVPYQELRRQLPDSRQRLHAGARNVTLAGAPKECQWDPLTHYPLLDLV